MPFNNIRTAWRSITRSRNFFAINVAGLTVSLTAFILMTMYMLDERGYDAFHTGAENIYRVVDDKQTPDVLLRSASSAAPVAPALQQDFPEIKQAVRLIQTESLIRYNDKTFEERRIYMSDPALFAVFSFPLLSGDPATALRDPFSIVLTETMRKKYFGPEDPTGKIMTVDGHSMTVTGTLRDVPANSHLQFDFLVSMATAQQKGSGFDWLFTNWYSNNFYTYIVLPPQYPVQQLLGKLPAFDKRHREAGSNTVHHYSLEKLTDIYLRSTRENQAGPTGNLSNLYIFFIVAMFILLMASINFINLSTARAAERAKEVAIKKIAGAGRAHMILQFFLESLLTVLLSFLLAALLAGLLLPYFNAFTGKSLGLDSFSFRHVAAFAAVLGALSFFSGCYPAFVLSGFSPVTALKGKINPSGWSIGVRRSLVVFQFAVSGVLIVCSLIVYHQMKYLQQHDLGFKPSQTLVINFEGDQLVRHRMSAITQELLQVPGVQQISASSNVPGDGNAGGWSMDFVRRNGDTIHTELPIYLVDFNFLSQYNIPVVAGRAPSQQFAADSVSSMLINETALRELGFRSAEEALGVHVGMYPREGIITGVIKDFHFKSLQTRIEPLAVRVMPDKMRLLSLRIGTGAVGSTLAALESRWKALVPGRPLEYAFLDASFNKQYASELRYGQVITLFTVLAIVLASLGLFGLAVFSTRQRTREIGIRKVLGASVAGIVSVISKEFVLLVLLSIVIASPVAWLLMTRWLQSFAYRTEVSPWALLLAGITGLGIALATIGFLTVRAATSNTVKSLRLE